MVEDVSYDTRIINPTVIPPVSFSVNVIPKKPVIT